MIAETVLNIRRALSITFLPWWILYVESLSQTSFSFSSLNWKDLVLFSPSDKSIISNTEVVSQFNNFKSIVYYFALFRGSTFFSGWVCRVFIQLTSTQPSCVSVRIYSLLLISSHSLFTASGIDPWWWVCLKAYFQNKVLKPLFFFLISCLY